MEKKSNIQQYKDIIVPIVSKHLPNAKIILYGSRARGDDTQGSDIDIALDSGKKIGETILYAIIGAIEDSTLTITFDIVDFHAVSEDMQTSIMKDGILWEK